MHIDDRACDAFWQAYLNGLAPEHPHRSARPDRFGFGGEPELAEELALLTLAGTKRATTSLAEEYTSLGEPLPRAGDLSIVVRGDGTPAAIIELTHVTTRPFAEVDATYAAIEGEGDGSLAAWRSDHLDYFGRVRARRGERFDPATSEVICKLFRVIWPQR